MWEQRSDIRGYSLYDVCVGRKRAQHSSKIAPISGHLWTAPCVPAIAVHFRSDSDRAARSFSDNQMYG